MIIAIILMLAAAALIMVSTINWSLAAVADIMMFAAVLIV